MRNIKKRNTLGALPKQKLVEAVRRDFPTIMSGKYWDREKYAEALTEELGFLVLPSNLPKAFESIGADIKSAPKKRKTWSPRRRQAHEKAAKISPPSGEFGVLFRMVEELYREFAKPLPKEAEPLVEKFGFSSLPLFDSGEPGSGESLE